MHVQNQQQHIDRIKTCTNMFLRDHTVQVNASTAATQAPSASKRAPGAHSATFATSSHLPTHSGPRNRVFQDSTLPDMRFAQNAHAVCG